MKKVMITVSTDGVDSHKNITKFVNILFIVACVAVILFANSFISSYNLSYWNIVPIWTLVGTWFYMAILMLAFNVIIDLLNEIIKLRLLRFLSSNKGIVLVDSIIGAIYFFIRVYMLTAAFERSPSEVGIIYINAFIGLIQNVAIVCVSVFVYKIFQKIFKKKIQQV